MPALPSVDSIGSDVDSDADAGVDTFAFDGLLARSNMRTPAKSASRKYLALSRATCTVDVATTVNGCRKHQSHNSRGENGDRDRFTRSLLHKATSDHSLGCTCVD